MVQFSFLRKGENKKAKSILESEKWTKINVQNRIFQKSLENRFFDFNHLPPKKIEMVLFLFIKQQKPRNTSCLLSENSQWILLNTFCLMTNDLSLGMVKS